MLHREALPTYAFFFRCTAYVGFVKHCRNATIGFSKKRLPQQSNKCYLYYFKAMLSEVLFTFDMTTHQSNNFWKIKSCFIGTNLKDTYLVFLEQSWFFN